MIITKRSILSGFEHSRQIDVDPDKYEAWRTGADRRMIQDVFPELSDDDREFMLSGITPEEWNAASLDISKEDTMEKYITLIGAEQVQSAANTMRHAAEEMQRAASNMDHSLTMHQRWMDDWLIRLEQVLEKLNKPSE
jgi:hypothetical protein